MGGCSCAQGEEKREKSCLVGRGGLRVGSFLILLSVFMRTIAAEEDGL